jgi:Zn-dependent peptidase ImmA (M78 family)
LKVVTHTGNPERDAVGLLRAAWARDYPDLPVPVDPFYIAMGLGIWVYVAVLDEGVSGMLVKRPGIDPVIYLNRLDSQNRQRFTCAHELGHYIKRADGDDEEWEYVDARGPTASKGSDPEEIYANQFAAALLMPREAIARLVKQGLTASEMAYRFGVSLEAMNWRLTNLGFKA